MGKWDDPPSRDPGSFDVIMMKDTQTQSPRNRTTPRCFFQKLSGLPVRKFWAVITSGFFPQKHWIYFTQENAKSTNPCFWVGTGILAPGLPQHQPLVAGSDHDAIAVTVALGATVNTTGTVSAVGAGPATEASTAVQVMGL